MQLAKSKLVQGTPAWLVFASALVLQLSYSLFWTNSVWLSLLTWLAIFYCRYILHALRFPFSVGIDSSVERYPGWYRDRIVFLFATQMILPVVSLFIAAEERERTGSVSIFLWTVLYNLGVFFHLSLHMGNWWYIHQSHDAIIWYIGSTLMYWCAVFIVKRYALFSLSCSYAVVKWGGALLTVVAFVDEGFLWIMIAVTVLLWIGLFRMLNRIL